MDRSRYERRGGGESQVSPCRCEKLREYAAIRQKHAAFLSQQSIEPSYDTIFVVDREQAVLLASSGNTIQSCERTRICARALIFTNRRLAIFSR